MNIEKKIEELEKKASWNHNYSLNGIQTIANQKFSIGNNKIKWKRINSVVDFNHKKVLDLGCSDGYFSHKSLDAGASSVFGIDLDPLRIEKAQFAHSICKYPNIKFAVKDVYEIDLEEEKYDIILCLGLLHRIPDMEKLLNKLSTTKKLVIETKIYDTKESVCQWGGASSKSNKFNNLYNIPSVNYLKSLLEPYFNNFKIDIDSRDQNVYKRGLIVCS